MVGDKMRCPNCEQLRDPLNERMFKRLDRNERYAKELNVVYQCVKSTGGCGHIFSPGDQRILMAFLSGDLVPAKHAQRPLEQAKDNQTGVNTDANRGREARSLPPPPLRHDANR
jgi:hypothetical protein